MRRAFTKAGAPAATALTTRAELEARLKLRAGGESGRCRRARFGECAPHQRPSSRPSFISR